MGRIAAERVEAHMINCHVIRDRSMRDLKHVAMHIRLFRLARSRDVTVSRTAQGSQPWPTCRGPTATINPPPDVWCYHWPRHTNITSPSSALIVRPAHAACRHLCPSRATNDTTGHSSGRFRLTQHEVDLERHGERHPHQLGAQGLAATVIDVDRQSTVPSAFPEGRVHVREVSDEALVQQKA